MRLVSDDLRSLVKKTNNYVPKHVDMREYYIRRGALGAYHIAQLLAIVNKGLLPYRAEIGKTPIIYIAYRRKES